jgi:hypothetical protein
MIKVDERLDPGHVWSLKEVMGAEREFLSLMEGSLRLI